MPAKVIASFEKARQESGLPGQDGALYGTEHDFLNMNTRVQNYNETILLEHVNPMHQKTIPDMYTLMIQQLHILLF